MARIYKNMALTLTLIYDFDLGAGVMKNERDTLLMMMHKYHISLNYLEWIRSYGQEKESLSTYIEIIP